MNEIMIELDVVTMTRLEIQAKATNQSVDELATQIASKGLDRLVDAMVGQLELSDKPVLN